RRELPQPRVLQRDAADDAAALAGRLYGAERACVVHDAEPEVHRDRLRDEPDEQGLQETRVVAVVWRVSGAVWR
ncbi:hypothetical protein QM261_18355, partial [Acinetobacter baumannii]|nr:hypothetical protein [Acinetobacter baumannii]